MFNLVKHGYLLLNMNRLGKTWLNKTTYVKFGLIWGFFF